MKGSAWLHETNSCAPAGEGTCERRVKHSIAHAAKLLVARMHDRTTVFFVNIIMHEQSILMEHSLGRGKIRKYWAKSGTGNTEIKLGWVWGKPQIMPVSLLSRVDLRMHEKKVAN